MSPFFEVVYELALFIKEAIFGKAVTDSDTRLLSQSHEQLKPSVLVHTQESFAHLSKPDVSDLPISGLSRAYITSQKAKVFARPVWAFDTVVAELDFGKEVSLLGFEGRFVRVEAESIRGWILKDNVSSKEGAVWPDLNPGIVYDASHEVTIRIRQIIADAFFASDLFLPLQPQEYIMYRLLRKSRQLPAVSSRPRLVGKWHDIYKGELGVTIGLEPKAGAVLEGLSLSIEPFLAYVSAVHTDESIVVESVGRNTDGEFLRETLVKVDWLNTQPVFIQF